jgi:hypothetical protein
MLYKTMKIPKLMLVAVFLLLCISSNAQSHAIPAKDKDVTRFLDSLSNALKFKERMKEADFRKYNVKAAEIMTPDNMIEGSWRSYSYYSYQKEPFGPCHVSFDKNNELFGLRYRNLYGKEIDAEAALFYEKLVAQIESQLPAEFLKKTDNSIEFYDPKINMKVKFEKTYDDYDKSTTVSTFILLNDSSIERP